MLATSTEVWLVDYSKAALSALSALSYVAVLEVVGIAALT